MAISSGRDHNISNSVTRMQIICMEAKARSAGPLTWWERISHFIRKSFAIKATAATSMSYLRVSMRMGRGRR